MVQHIVGRIVGTIVKVIVFLIIAIVVFGNVVHSLWNWLMPALFHLPLITFWQALGLMALGWILFGGLRGGGRHGWGRGGAWRRGMHGRWEQMSPEEQEKVREWMRHRCGPVPNVSADAAPKA
jgi:hypothetical protein